MSGFQLNKANECTKNLICWIVLFIISIIAVGSLSLFHSQRPSYTIIADSLRYYDAARNLYEGRQFSFFPSHPKFAYGLPGYPLFICLTAWLHGSLDPGFAIQIQIFLNALVVIFTFLAARLFCTRLCSLVAATMAAFLPNLLFNSLLLLSDQLSIVLFSLAFLLLLHAVKSQRIHLFAIAGLAFGAALYVKQVYQIPVAITAVALLFILKKNFLQKLLAAFLLLFVMLLTITPWIIRNERIFGRYSLELSTNFGSVMMFSHVPYEVYEQKYLNEIVPVLQKLYEQGRYAEAELLDDKAQLDIAFDYMREDPWRTFWDWLGKGATILRPYLGVPADVAPLPFNIIWTIYYSLLFMGLIISFVLRPPPPYFLINLIFIISLFLFQTTNHTNLRFRLGYELPMVLLSAWGWMRLLRDELGLMRVKR